MLAKISSAAGGIREYLETGRKKGREYDRELIDDRLPICGDIDVMEAAIDSIQTQQRGDHRYLHITLGFAEQFTASDVPGEGQINFEMIRQATEEYRTLLMAAYDPAEYVFYAEAHIPKVTHDVNASTGEYEQRLPHVHIVIPKVNLETGQYLDPMGWGHANIKFHDAIQEKINHDFSFKSPDDNPRSQSPNPLAKHNERFAELTPKQLRQQITKMLDQGQATSFDDVVKLAQAYGDVKIRKGKDGDYINVKPEWSDKGINLKEFTQEKLTAWPTRTLVDQPRGGRLAEIESTVSQWTEARSLEVRYVTSAGMKKAYKAMTVEEQGAYLLSKKAETKQKLETYNESPAQFGARLSAGIAQRIKEKQVHKPISRNVYQQLDALIKEQDYDRANERAERINGSVGRNSRNESDHHDKNRGANRDDVNAQRSGRVGEATRNSLSNTDGHSRDSQSTGAVINEPTRTRLDRSKEMLRQSREIAARIAAFEERPELGTKRLDNQRTLNAIKTVVQRLQVHPPKSERTKSVIDTLAQSQRVGLNANQLKNSTSPIIVLETAKRLYGIDLSQYSVGAGRDGTPRIFHDQKQYNLGDFFTKHLGKTWDESKPVLTECYYATLSDALPPPDKALWASFNEWRSHAYEHRKTNRELSSQQLRKETLTARSTYQARKEEGAKLKGKARQSFMAKARADHILTTQGIKEKREASFHENKTPNRNAEYRSYLTGLAGKGDLTALGELRRLSSLQQQDQSFITGDKSRDVLPLPQYRIDAQGTVTYWFKGEVWEPLVRDSTKGVAVVKNNTEAYDTALKIAVARYGRTLTFKGDDIFMKKMMEAAKRSGMDLTIRDGNGRNKPVTKVSPEKTR